MERADDPHALRDAIEAEAHRLGFALVGVARAAPTSHREALERWIADGKHGEMAWIAERAADACDVRRLLRNARSVICVGDRYHDGRPDRVDARADGGDAAAPRGRIARYARGKDYHDLVRDRLRKLGRFIRERVPECQTRLTGDIHPILEREQAARALLGAIGKHTLLIRPRLGSYYLLGEIVTDADIAPSDAPPPPVDICGSCTRCIDACPTGAITPWSVDATRCTAYLTIEHRGAIPDEFFGTTGDWWFGCDICQEVCPHAQPTRASRRAGVHPIHAPRRDGIDLLEVLGWSDADRARLVVSSALKRASLAMMRRNALLALASFARTGVTARGLVRERAERIACDDKEDDIVRAAARATLAAIDRMDATPRVG